MIRRILWPQNRDQLVTFSVIAGRFFFYLFLLFACFDAFLGYTAARNGGGGLPARVVLATIGFLGPFFVGRLARLILAGE